VFKLFGFCDFNESHIPHHHLPLSS
jgi:hypothetical protein